MTRDDARAWFEALQECVNTVDYDRAERELFAGDAMAFGTFARLVEGIPDIKREQWENVWPNIKDFRFDFDSLRSGDNWGAIVWMSTGFEENGEPFERPGRATVVFRRESGRLLALHTHFSLAPR